MTGTGIINTSTHFLVMDFVGTGRPLMVCASATGFHRWQFLSIIKQIDDWMVSAVRWLNFPSLNWNEEHSIVAYSNPCKLTLRNINGDPLRCRTVVK